MGSANRLGHEGCDRDDADLGLREHFRPHMYVPDEPRDETRLLGESVTVDDSLPPNSMLLEPIRGRKGTRYCTIGLKTGSTRTMSIGLWLRRLWVRAP